MGIKLFLSSDEILNHVFAGVPKGYDPLDVDEFLDKVLADYRTVESNLLITKNELEEEHKQISVLKAKIASLESDLAQYKTRFSNIKPTDKVNSDNIDYIKRINALESFLFNKGYDPTRIK